MAVQIDTFDTTVKIDPPTKAAQPRERDVPPSGPTSVSPALQDAVLTVLTEQFESFFRMRGH